jgi:type IV secretion system protein VirD4
MYKLARLMLTLAIAFYAYFLVLFVILALAQFGLLGWILLLVFAGAAVASRKGRWLLTAFGTAAWASAAGLSRAGMLHANKGLILGRIADDMAWPSGRGIQALLNPRLGAKDACREFFDAIRYRRRKQGRLVRLPQAVHTMVVAPTGVGKGVSCILPFLLTCEESCVVVDFKGESALLTAEHRRRLGHRIVILDPFKVVTQ